MKNRDIQLGITSHRRRTDREGEAADLGRVVKLRDVKFRSQQLEEDEVGGLNDVIHRMVILRWSLMLGGGAIVVIGLAISFWLLSRPDQHSGEKAAAPINNEGMVRIASKFPSPSKDEALDMVKRAISNRDPEKVESLFRLGAATRPEVVDFFKNLEKREGEVDRFDWLSSMDVDGLLIEGVLVVFKGKDKTAERIAFLTPDSSGNWKVDFDAFARSVKPSWSELLGKGADHGRVRVFVGHDDYYNGPFRDEKQWICYGMASPDTEQLLHGYCRVGSPQAEAMEKLFSDGVETSRATLEISRVKDGEPRQFEIVRLMAADWVLADTSGN